MTQISFDPFDYEEQAIHAGIEQRAFAKAERDAKYRELKQDPDVKYVRRFVLKSQLEKYRSFGVPGRGYRDVFYVEYRTF